MKTDLKKKGNLPALVIGTALYIVAFFAIAGLNVYLSKGLASGKIPPSDAGVYTGFNGVISQLQVLIAVIIVMLDRKRGFYVGMGLVTFSTFNVLIKTIIINKNMAALPGFVTDIVSLVLLAIIHVILERNLNLHDEVTANYEKVIEQNHMIEAKDKALVKLAYYDRLTGLPNAAFYTEKLQEYIDNSTPFAMIYMDMDNFKQINDNFGHECGDELIKTYSNRFQKYCGDKYTCAKVGGDEFAMILVGKYTEADIMNIVEQLRTLFMEPVQMPAGSFTITMSYGIAGYPNDGGTPENLINAADTALYNAKIGGKNRPCFYSQNSLG